MTPEVLELAFHQRCSFIDALQAATNGWSTEEIQIFINPEFPIVI